jgi:hypothetical protein
LFIGTQGDPTIRRIVDRHHQVKAVSAMKRGNMAEYWNYLDMGSRAVYENTNQAAHAWGLEFNPVSIEKGVEFAATMYEVTASNDPTVSFIAITEARRGTEAASQFPDAPAGTKEISNIHSHGSYSPHFDNDRFSPTDKKTYYGLRMPGYVITPNGSLQRWDPKGSLQKWDPKGKWAWRIGKRTTLLKSLPSDPNHKKFK